MSNWIELNKTNGVKVLIRADSINAVEQTTFMGQDYTMVSGSGYAIRVEENYFDVLSLMAERGELLIK